MKNLSLGIILFGLASISLKSNAAIKADRENVLIDTLQKRVIDPVCKMKIKPTGVKTTVYNKFTFYFCSESCKQKFVAEPAKYVKK
ncbi:YHS domain-containing protein [Pedobacter aquatilis]|uniref:YHS domain-containing protein n=1 Tax=Pedobacter aquatilis TaxID=351343 RepID=UPI0025B3B128|nr:YHS domain-containing protein [Pedobacter aquatilis]MDN3588259.1 YHS domain-containing protein [Pedobacter aquatilis]